LPRSSEYAIEPLDQIGQGTWLKCCKQHRNGSQRLRFAAPTQDDPLFSKEMRQLESMRKELLRRYGESFDQAYGWAAYLFKDGRIGPMRLASTLDMEHGRPDYIAQSHELHPTAWGWELNLELSGQVSSWRLTGLAEPANASMIRLAQIMSDTLTDGRTGASVNYYDMVGISTVFQLVEEAEHAFVDAETIADSRIEVEAVHPQPRPMRPSNGWESTSETEG
jgi:hypothetical protein